MALVGAEVVLRALDLPEGSMGAKVEAACDFVESTGRTAVIGSLDRLDRVASLAVGTVVTA